MKKWVISRPLRETSDKIARETDISALCADILVARGYKSGADAAERLSAEKLFDPFILKDMKEAAEIINDAVDNFDRICIYGDYDCDGIVSTVILFSYLECMGADVTYHIPERAEGYGLNEDAVRKMSDEGVKLIITVDNGISALKEAELIYKLGMKLVVTDHHQPGENLPRAEAVVDAHRKDCPSVFKTLCGAGVVLKLIAALEGGDYTTVFEEYDELAAVATIADIVELSSENRLIVSRGLKLLANSERCGVNALMKVSGVKPPVSSTSVAFGISPRINASGRFGSPSTAARLLLTDSEEEAEMLARELDRLNELRKQEENKIIDSIGESVNSDPDAVCNRVIVLWGENWHSGVIGIVAARILERFDKPTFIITVEGNEARGSARAFGSFSVFKALQYCSDLLTKFGGHSGAGGFSLKTENIPAFAERLQQFADEQFDLMPVPVLTADKQILPGEMTVAEIKSLKVLEPFGEGNSQPLFAVLGAEVLDKTGLKNGLHTKLLVNYGGKRLELLLFRRSPGEVFLRKGDKANFMVNIEVREYMGRENLSIVVKDYRKSGISQSRYFAAKDAYEKFRRGQELPTAFYKKICPEREELVGVYKKLAAGRYSVDTLYTELASDSMNYCKLCICTDIFEELGFIGINRFTGEITLNRGAGKMSLDNSEILTELREMI